MVEGNFRKYCVRKKTGELLLVNHLFIIFAFPLPSFKVKDAAMGTFKEGVCQALVFALFEPEKFNQHKQRQSGGRCPWLRRGYRCCMFLVQVSQGLKSGTAAKIPRFFCHKVPETSVMLHGWKKFFLENRIGNKSGGEPLRIKKTRVSDPPATCN